MTSRIFNWPYGKGNNPEMPRTINLLESFNRKERFFLIGQALGNPEFQLSGAFRDGLSEAFGLQIPENALVFMDYHLDWVNASLYLAIPEVDEAAVHSNDEALISGNQEDIDLLVAFERGDVTYLLLIEAKAESGWTNRQMDSKSRRLENIFGADGNKYPHVEPHFCLISPRKPQQLKSQSWPDWMVKNGRPIWMELDVPEGRRRAIRCYEDGVSSAEGGFFRIVKST